MHMSEFQSISNSNSFTQNDDSLHNYAATSAAKSEMSGTENTVMSVKPMSGDYESSAPVSMAQTSSYNNGTNFGSSTTSYDVSSAKSEQISSTTPSSGAFSQHNGNNYQPASLSTGQQPIHSESVEYDAHSSSLSSSVGSVVTATATSANNSLGQSVTHPQVPAPITAIMEGPFQCSPGYGHIRFSGEWHIMGDAVRSKFEYRTTAAVQVPSNGLSTTEHISASLVGHFMLKQLLGKPEKKVAEKSITLHIGGSVPQSQEDSARVSSRPTNGVLICGDGRNQFGQFDLLGEYDPNTGIALLRKRYRPLTKPKTNVSSASKRSSSRPLGSTPDHPRSRRSRNVPSRFVHSDSAAAKDLTPELQNCKYILDSLMRRQEAQWFLAPVDPIVHGVPNYHDIIKNPMDFGTIQSKLLSGEYKIPHEWAADMNLVFENAITFNPEGTIIHEHAQKVLQMFNDMYSDFLHARESEDRRRREQGLPRRKVEKRRKYMPSTPLSTGSSYTPNASVSKSGRRKRKSDDDSSTASNRRRRKASGIASLSSPMDSLASSLSAIDQNNPVIAHLLQHVSSLEAKIEMLLQNQQAQAYGAPVTPSSYNLRRSMNTRESKRHVQPLVGPGGVYDTAIELDVSEQRQLAYDVSKLDADQTNRVVQIISEHHPLDPQHQGQIEIDIGSLNITTLRHLQHYVDTCLGRTDTPPRKRGRLSTRAAAKTSRKARSKPNTPSGAPASTSSFSSADVSYSDYNGLESGRPPQSAPMTTNVDQWEPLDDDLGTSSGLPPPPPPSSAADTHADDAIFDQQSVTSGALAQVSSNHHVIDAKPRNDSMELPFDNAPDMDTEFDLDFGVWEDVTVTTAEETATVKNTSSTSTSTTQLGDVLAGVNDRLDADAEVAAQREVVEQRRNQTRADEEASRRAEYEHEQAALEAERADAAKREAEQASELENEKQRRIEEARAAREAGVRAEEEQPDSDDEFEGLGGVDSEMYGF